MMAINLDKVRRGDGLLDEAAALRRRAGLSIRTITNTQLIGALMDKLTYSVKEVAELAGYSTETVRRHIRRGDLTAAQTGRGHYRIARAELAKWWSQTLGGGALFDASHSHAERLAELERENAALRAELKAAGVKK